MTRPWAWTTITDLVVIAVQAQGEDADQPVRAETPWGDVGADAPGYGRKFQPTPQGSDREWSGDRQRGDRQRDVNITHTSVGDIHGGRGRLCDRWDRRSGPTDRPDLYITAYNGRSVSRSVRSATKWRSEQGESSGAWRGALDRLRGVARRPVGPVGHPCHAFTVMRSPRCGALAPFAVSLLDILRVVAHRSAPRAADCDGLPMPRTSFVDPAATSTFAVLRFTPKTTRFQRLMGEANIRWVLRIQFSEPFRDGVKAALDEGFGVARTHDEYRG